MLSMDILGWDKKKTGSVSISSDFFDAEPRKDILHAIVKWQLACRRQGTHKAKNRGEVSGTGAKPYKQKGTGNARQGSFQSPLLEGGGVHFAKTPRDYSYSLNKKFKKLGFQAALSQVKKEDCFFVISDMKSEAGKTKELVQKLKQLGVSKALLVDSQLDDNFKRASRNISQVKYCLVEGVNAYDLLKYKNLVVTESAMKSLEKRCLGGQ